MKTSNVLEFIPAGVTIDGDSLDQLVLAGRADPELVREELRRVGISAAGSKIMASSYSVPVGHAGEPIHAAPYPAAIVHPLAPPTISNTSISLDLALQQPTRITHMIMDLSLQRFFIDRVFTSAGGVSGGAVIYDEWVANDIYLDRDVERVAPGAEFPIVTGSRRAPKVAEVEKWGGKFFYTDESRDRNNVGEFTRFVRQLTNTIVRKMNQRGVEILDAVISANSRTLVGTHSWSDVITAFTGQSNWDAMPWADFALAQLKAEQEELGITYDLWILNPNEYFTLNGIYGPDLAAILARVGISVYVTNRVAAGTAYIVASGMLGEMRVEQPLATETWRDPNGKQQTWVQSSVRPLMFADNPFAVLKATGLNA